MCGGEACDDRVEQVIAAQPKVNGLCIGTSEHQGSIALVAWYRRVV